MVSPFALAVGGVSPLRFTALTMIGAALWSVSIAGGGYLFGHGLTLVLARAHRYEAEALGFLALAGLLVWLTRVLRERRHAA
jgi:membrane protein DedA with SNARE-associated domain